MTDQEFKVLEVELKLDGERIDRCTASEIKGEDGTYNHTKPVNIVFQRLSKIVVTFRPCKNHLNFFLAAYRTKEWSKHWKIVE